MTVQHNTMKRKSKMYSADRRYTAHVHSNNTAKGKKLLKVLEELIKKGATNAST